MDSLAFRGEPGVHPEIKFCGLTREADAAMAASLGARYVGAIFAGGPRELTPGRAAAVLAAAGRNVQRVGVFGTNDAGRIGEVADEAGLDVIQLHSDPTVADIKAVVRATGRLVWPVVRTADGTIPAHATTVLSEAAAVVFDAKVAERLGGTGVTLPWGALAAALRSLDWRGALVLAGGLTPGNVSSAIDALEPTIVDVSSGVESAPGIKDYDKMKAFAEAVWTQR